jgi:hypothetical protein
MDQTANFTGNLKKDFSYYIQKLGQFQIVKANFLFL